MKKFVRLVTGLLMVWLMASNVASGGKVAHGMGALQSLSVMVVVAGICLMAAPFVRSAENVMRCDTVGLSQVFWERAIMKRWFKDNGFLGRVNRVGDQYIVGGSAVVIPQPGSAPTVIKNNSSFPLVAVQRADNMVMYPLSWYTTQPTQITLEELMKISYDKVDSVLKDHFGYLIQYSADDQLINWADGLPGATNVVYTTGAPTADLETGQTGQRNSCRWQDLKRIQKLMNKANTPREGRVAMFESNMLDQFTDSLSSSIYKDFDKEYDPKAGSIGRLFGFDIMERSSVIQAGAAYDSGNLNVNALGASMGATDNVGCLVWQEDCLELALGSIKLFSRLEDPLYSGDVHSAVMKAGGRVRRADNGGVYALMQGTPAG